MAHHSTAHHTTAHHSTAPAAAPARPAPRRRRIVAVAAAALVVVALVYTTAQVTRATVTAERCADVGTVAIALTGEDDTAPAAADLEWAARHVLGPRPDLPVAATGDRDAAALLPGATVSVRSGVLTVRAELGRDVRCSPPGATWPRWVAVTTGLATGLATRVLVMAHLRPYGPATAVPLGELAGEVLARFVRTGTYEARWPYHEDGESLARGLAAAVGPERFPDVYAEVDRALHVVTAGVASATGRGWFDHLAPATHEAGRMLKLLGDATFDTAGSIASSSR